MKTGLSAIDADAGLILLTKREIELLRKRYGKRITVQAQTLIQLALSEVLKDEQAKQDVASK